MFSVRNGLLEPPIVLPARDPTLGGLIASDKKGKLDRGETESPFSLETRTRPPIVLPPRDPTIGLDLVERCDKPTTEETEVCKMLFLPQRIDIDKINEYYRNEDLKIINKNRAKEKAQVKPRNLQNSAPRSPNVNKGCRKALFKPSRTSVRCSFRKNRTSILGRKSTVPKNMKNINGSLLDASLVEKKIFNSKSQATFKFKSPIAVRMNITKLPIVKPQKKKDTPKNLEKKDRTKNVEKKPAATTTTATATTTAPTTKSAVRRIVASSKKPEMPCKNSIADYLKEMKDLIVLGKDNLSKDLDAFKKAQEDRFAKMEDLLQKIELSSCECKSRDDPKPTVTAKAVENNLTPIKSMGRRVDTLRVSTLKKTVKFDSDVKALKMYDSMRQACCVALSTPKITRVGALVESPTPKDSKKIMSRKILQQCLMLQDTPMKK